jgi:hypothetical protein
VLTPLDSDLLERNDIPCMVVGSVASTVWGEPRSTLDIDLVIAARTEDAERIAAIFREPRYYAPPLAIIQREIARGAQGTFNLIDTTTGLKADIYPGASDPVNAWGMARRVRVETTAGIIFVAPVSCVIAGKLRYFAISRQDKHLRDIRGTLRLSMPRSIAPSSTWWRGSTVSLMPGATAWSVPGRNSHLLESPRKGP